MKFIHRLAFYLGGFSIGLLILFFILDGKDASCDYSPNARVKKNIRIKPKVYNENALQLMQNQNLDTTHVAFLLEHGKVDFSKSDTNTDTCNVYTINGKTEIGKLQLIVENCPEQAKILSLTKTTD